MISYYVFNIPQSKILKRSVSVPIDIKKKPVLIKPKLKRHIAIMPTLFNLSRPELTRSQTC